MAHNSQEITSMSILAGAEKNGNEAQAPLPPDATPKLDAKGIKRVKKIVGSIFY